MKRFRSSHDGDVHERFPALTQEGPMMEYREKYGLLLRWLTGISETMLASSFRKGLNLKFTLYCECLSQEG